jgi:subtilisin family serine protease
VLAFFFLFPVAGCVKMPAYDVTHALLGLDTISARIEQRGTTRVIVRLSKRVAPEGVSAPRLAASQNKLLADMKSAGVTTAKAIKGLRFVVLEINKSQLDQLVASGEVDAVFEDKIERAHLIDSTQLINAPQTWVQHGRGNGQAVAILDTGVDANHPFLENRIVSEACYSTTFNAAGAVTACPDGNQIQIGAGSSASCGLNGCNHGTHVAGIAAGEGAAFSGVAPDFQNSLIGPVIPAPGIVPTSVCHRRVH